jgi:hypothetical protein
MFRLVLILILIAGSVVMAPSRGQMAGVTQIAICSDAGTETLTLDARGNPVAAHHPCPDCVPCLATGPLPDTGGLQRISIALPLSYPLPRQIAAAGTLAVHPTARDPPLSA